MDLFRYYLVRSLKIQMALNFISYLMKQVLSPSQNSKTSIVKTWKCVKFIEYEHEHILCFIKTEDYLFLASTTPPPSEPGPPHSWGFLDHIQRRITVGRTPLDEWSARRRDLYLTTQHSQQTDIHAPGGIRTRNFSRRAAADLRLRRRGHWDRHQNMIMVAKFI